MNKVLGLFINTKTKTNWFIWDWEWTAKWSAKILRSVIKYSMCAASFENERQKQTHNTSRPSTAVTLIVWQSTYFQQERQEKRNDIWNVQQIDITLTQCLNVNGNRNWSVSFVWTTSITLYLTSENTLLPLSNMFGV